MARSKDVKAIKYFLYLIILSQLLLKTDLQYGIVETLPIFIAFRKEHKYEDPSAFVCKFWGLGSMVLWG